MILTWATSRLSELLVSLGRKSLLTNAVLANDIVAPFSERLSFCAAQLHLEVLPMRFSASDRENILRLGGPCLVEVSADQILVVLPGNRILCPDDSVISARKIRGRIASLFAEPEQLEVERHLGGLSRRQKRRLRDLLSIKHPEVKVWMLRSSIGSFNKVRRELSLNRDLLSYLLLHVAQLAAWSICWYLFALLVASPSYSMHLVQAWMLALICVGVARTAETSSGRLLGVTAGAALKQHLLASAMQLEPQEVRHEGIGGFYGRIVEAEAVEILGVAGFLFGLRAVTYGVAGAFLLAKGVGGLLHAAVAALFVVAIIILSVRLYRRRNSWTSDRFALTARLTELLVGHRTRLAQERTPETKHQGLLTAYAATSADLNQSAVHLDLLRRSWLYVAIFSLVPFLLAPSSFTAIAFSVSGVFLTQRAVWLWAESLGQWSGALVALRSVRPLLARGHQAQERAEHHLPDTGVLELKSVTFSYSNEPILRNASLRVHPGDRIRVEGESGAGKSTFARLLAGEVDPDHGLLTFAGLPIEVASRDAWRRRVVVAPQFYDNHIFVGSLAYNLLIGRQWPATDTDLMEAESLCRELGLGGVLDRMPLGIHQYVGEAGWRLSHGERSRVFAARALLQTPAVLILDETLGALDKITMQATIDCVLRHTSTLVLIHHD